MAADNTMMFFSPYLISLSLLPSPPFLPSQWTLLCSGCSTKLNKHFGINKYFSVACSICQSPIHSLPPAWCSHFPRSDTELLQLGCWRISENYRRNYDTMILNSDLIEAYNGQGKNKQFLKAREGPFLKVFMLQQLHCSMRFLSIMISRPCSALEKKYFAFLLS